MTRYGLIGAKLSHSFSKNYFEKKFLELHLKDHAYDNFELKNISELPGLVASEPALKGLNVTIPFKEEVLDFLHETDNEAKEIGAVNCIKISEGRLTGFNTDAYGFSQSLKPFLDTNHERALILGTGGASKAVTHVLKKIGVEVFYVTSKADKKKPNTFYYEELNSAILNACKLIVNTTPVGTFPETAACPALPYDLITPEHLAYDLIYNPAETMFLKKAAQKGAIVVNGLSMLQLQAEKSWQIWNS